MRRLDNTDKRVSEHISNIWLLLHSNAVIFLDD